MIDISLFDHGVYKPGIEYAKMGSIFLLDQNPNSGSIFAKAAQNGHTVQWELYDKPVAGAKLAYTGNVIINGVTMSKTQAYNILTGKESIVWEQ